MNTGRSIPTPTARVRFGFPRCDITPPVGIYHRFWGAANHDVATGVHRPLTATALVFGPSDADRDSRCIIVATDHCLFRPADMRDVLDRVAEQADVPRDQLLFQFAHTHSGGHIVTQRSDQPGGELIRPYLDMVIERVAESVRIAVEATEPCVLTVCKTSCDMGNQRDDWDVDINRHVCGFQPDGRTGYPVKAVRVTDDNYGFVMTLVNYPCHPTTLAWDNSLISPDYVGALRETVEQSTGAPCTFLLAPCGDVGPRYGFVGDTDVADRNGRQVGFAAL
ncbi:MAG: neutral/alkaline non-lysosomal ceramidase N-terminal domain-containing protein [Planctomycetota bacterium]|nr:neutral/alkaline non-lysosomal ceramidase N-terminal domain-containing protein [Planctomycetota bacterium]